MTGRYLAPAGAPIRPADVARWLGGLSNLRTAEEDFASAICLRTGRTHCSLASTGRAGLSVLLSALKSLAPDNRDEVVLPSYTCFSVAASVVRAGLRLRLVDIDPTSLDFRMEALGNTDFRRVLAIVATNLYGLPNDMPRLSSLARDNGVYLIDDAAQAFGAAVGGRQSGTWGDAGLLSFDKGKNVSAIDGGAILSDSQDVSEAVSDRVRRLPPPAGMDTAERLFKLAIYVGFLPPRRYWLPNALPGLGLGKTVYRPDFPITRQSRLLAALGSTMLDSLDEFHRARVSTADRLRTGLSRASHLTFVEPAADAAPAYLRFPVLAADASMRDAMISALNRSGVGATRSYPGTIADIPQLRSLIADRSDAGGGRSVANRILTLPTHPYVTRSDVDRMVDVLSGFGKVTAVTNARSALAG